jgi:tRNA pseudouridine38-40 synthase
VPTWKLTLEYDGTAFCGWQVQPTGVSLQGELERALAQLHGGSFTRVQASGRTDAGVHARGQVVSFRSEKPLAAVSYVRGLNTLLPPAIAVRHAEEAPDGFDARRWARGKRYVYRLLPSRTRSPLRASQVWQLFQPLDVDAMRGAAWRLLGTHDFSAFRASDCQAKGAVRELRRLDVEAVGDEVLFTVEATAFLKHMVRNLVGTLVDAGLGKRTPDDVAAILASRDRNRAGRTAPAQGLCLDEVFYDLAAGCPLDDADEE